MLSRNGFRFLTNRSILRSSLTLSRAITSGSDKKEELVMKPLPSRPINYENEEFTKFIESKDDFKYVEGLIPNVTVPDPPVHDSYPTPSGWVPINVNKANKWSYKVLRTRFHNYPIYAEEREGGNRKITRIRSIEGDIWAFERDLKEYLTNRVSSDLNKKITIVTSVNEFQRHVLVKGAYQNYVSDFLKEKGF